MSTNILDVYVDEKGDRFGVLADRDEIDEEVLREARLRELATVYDTNELRIMAMDGINKDMLATLCEAKKLFDGCIDDWYIPDDQKGVIAVETTTVPPPVVTQKAPQEVSENERLIDDYSKPIVYSDKGPCSCHLCSMVQEETVMDCAQNRIKVSFNEEQISLMLSWLGESGNKLNYRDDRVSLVAGECAVHLALTQICKGYHGWKFPPLRAPNLFQPVLFQVPMLSGNRQRTGLAIWRGRGRSATWKTFGWNATPPADLDHIFLVELITMKEFRNTVFVLGHVEAKNVWADSKGFGMKDWTAIGGF